MKTYHLVMLSGVMIAGAMAVADDIVEVAEDEARNLLHRNKARLATAEDGEDFAQADGPTIEEYVAAGYDASNYPPDGYASRSTDEEILAAIEAQEAAKKTAAE